MFVDCYCFALTARPPLINLIKTDTTSITLTYALYILSMDQEAQQLCFDEASSVESLDNPSDLVYCTAVIQETLRLFPPGPQTNRSMGKSKKLGGGFIVPKDTLVFVPIWSIHRDEKVFPKPNDFRPDRWVKKVDKDSIKTGEWVERPSMDEPIDEPGCSIPAANRKALFAFSAGGRSCGTFSCFAITALFTPTNSLISFVSFCYCSWTKVCHAGGSAGFGQLG